MVDYTGASKVTFSEDWKKERDAKKLERDMKSFQRRMATPVMRGEVYNMGELQLQHIASLALAVEALENILIERGLLLDDELMDRMQMLAHEKQQIAEASKAAEPSLIAQV